ncbi:hypothetical protein TMatcc_007640 [Talaromyces marneffei ATCC 18224]|uniref:Sequence orphan n=2 Tax=Talaromyces marneffei TaxID=37727 RepID=B6QGF1_TALMQ|nr:uncharacterized protein EYB26_004578 [Talaromyces marneffei]EEA24536.1 conserved hypothetical protein [Talaromyces marneffei ATCC 18224]KAE8552960.1 hypothetical protein EYB25_004339 [Talaromyces marneffei]QGA16908.1 hypothetical protein EYB26_004578 [Talaromyces marneffei]
MARDAAQAGVPAIPIPTTKSGKQWNTRSLGLRFAADAASAAVAGALICPIITIIDRAIIEKASKGISIKHTLSSCLRDMIRKPSGFFLSTPFILIYTLYSGTYLTANAIDTITSTLRNQPFETVTPGTAKFLTTTIVNMSICVYKDARFAKLFGPSSNPSTQCHPSAPAVTVAATNASASTSAAAAATAAQIAKQAPTIPKVSYALFCLRDSVTIFASFNVPPLIAPSVPDWIASTPGMKAAVAQFSCPALMQFVSTPMHLLGLDLYNRQPPGGLGWRERLLRIRRDYIVSSFARMGKIVPAYGVGGVVNVRMRAALMDKLQLDDERKHLSSCRAL